MSYTVIRPEDQVFKTPSWRPDDPARTIVELPALTELRHSRCHLWRYPPGASGHRHKQVAQEEVFVVLEGTFTIELGDPAETFELPPRSLVVVGPGTPILLQNRSSEEAVAFIYGAPADREVDVLEKMW
ncbi:MAG: cupin domain-containing protein [Gaiella sp.]